VPSGTYAVVLQVPTEADLLMVAYGLAMARIEHTLILENDPPYNGQAMAIGLAPTTDRARLKSLLKDLPLYGT
jgi:hypothetical protein